MINRSNYEIFMIDYLDGKLNADQVAELLLFLEANPDIAEEFDGLGDVHLAEESSEFKNKAALKKEELPVEEEELDLLLAKKLEGDLNPEEEVLLDELLLAYPQVSKSWRAFELTRIPVAKEVFDGKSELQFPEKVLLDNDDHLLIAEMEGDLDSEQIGALASRLQTDSNFEASRKLFTASVLKPDMSVVYPHKSKLKRTPVIALFARVGSTVAAAAAIALFLIFSGGDSQTGSGIARHEVEAGIKEVTHEASSTQETVFAVETENEGSTEPDVQQPMQQDVRPLSPVQFAFQSLPKRDVQLLESTAVSTGVPVYARRDIVPYELEEPVAAIQNPEQFPTVRQFLGDKVKEGLWGGKDYPEEDYTLALLGKAADKYNDRSGSDLEIGKEKKEEEDKFFFRLGKLTISR